MKRKYILFLICSFFLGGVSAQTLEQARPLFTKGDYEKAKPVFKKYAKSQPSNGNYNYWYGVCCLKTGEAEEERRTLRLHHAGKDRRLQNGRAVRTSARPQHKVQLQDSARQRGHIAHTPLRQARHTVV